MFAAKRDPYGSLSASRSPKEPTASSLELSPDVLGVGDLTLAPLLRLNEERGVRGMEEPSARPSSSSKPEAEAAAMTSSSLACGFATCPVSAAEEREEVYANVLRNGAVENERLLRHISCVSAETDSWQLRVGQPVEYNLAPSAKAHGRVLPRPAAGCKYGG